MPQIWGKIQKFDPQNYFWDMNIWYKGYLEHPKKCSKMDFWDPQTTLWIRFLSWKKNLFFAIWGSINSKNNFFGLWVWKMIFFENSWVAYVPCTRNLGAFEFLLPSQKIDFEVIGAFLGPFLRVDRRKSLAGAPLKKLRNFKKFLKKNLRYFSIFWNSQLRCATKSRWDILKNFWRFFLSPHGNGVL